MDTFKVCHFRFIACCYQCFKACCHQLANTAAQNCLFPKQVCFCFFLEGCFQNTCSACADCCCISQCKFFCLAGFILFYCNQAGNAAALCIQASYNMTGALRRYHGYIQIICGLNLAVMDVEAMREHQCVAFLHVLCNLVFVDSGSQFIGNQHHNYVACFRCFFDTQNLQTCCFCLCNVCRAGSQTYNNIYAAFLQVHGMGMTLAAKADDSDCFAVQHT